VNRDRIGLGLEPLASGSVSHLKVATRSSSGPLVPLLLLLYVLADRSLIPTDSGSNVVHVEFPFVELERSTKGSSSSGSRNCQTSGVFPAEPGGCFGHSRSTPTRPGRGSSFILAGPGRSGGQRARRSWSHRTISHLGSVDLQPAVA